MNNIPQDFTKMVKEIKVGQFESFDFDTNGIYYVRLPSLNGLRFVSLKIYTDFDEFKKSIANSNFKFYSDFIAAFTDVGKKFSSTYIKMWFDTPQTVWILHQLYEDKNLQIPTNGRILELNDDGYACNDEVILRMKILNF